MEPDLVHDSPPHTQVVCWVGGEYARCGSRTCHSQVASTVCPDGICKHQKHTMNLRGPDTFHPVRFCPRCIIWQICVSP